MNKVLKLMMIRTKKIDEEVSIQSENKQLTGSQTPILKKKLTVLTNGKKINKKKKIINISNFC
jgi:hypothetical protein